MNCGSCEPLRQENVGHVELVVRRGVLLACDVLIHFVRRDDDMGDHIALPQRAQDQFLAHRLAIELVIHTLRGKCRGQLIERYLVSSRNVLQRAVQLFIGNRQAHMLRALHLYFLQHQAIEHLLPEHILRGQFDFLILEPLGDRIHLRIQLAFQHQAVIHDGRNPVEKLAVNADVAGLGRDCGR